MSGRRGYVPVDPPGGVTDLTAPTPPAQGPPEPSGTTSVSITYTHPDAPDGTAWTLHVIDQATDSPIVPSSGADLGAYAIPVSDGTRAVHWMDAEGPDGQTSRSTPSVIVVESATADADYAVVEGSTIDFTGSNFTALSSSGTTQSTTAWQHTIYAADGVTPVAYVGNNTSTARTLSLTPSDVGLKLTCGADTGAAIVDVWPAGWDDIIGGSRDDAWVAEFVVGGEEPSGSGAFVHILGVSTGFTNASPLVGVRVINSGSNAQINGVAYPVAPDEVTLATVTAGAARSWTARVQVRLIDGGSAIRVWVEPSTTAMASPRTGTYSFKVQRPSEAIGTGQFAVPADVFASTIAGRLKLVLYHDRVAGGTTSTSYVRLISARLWKKTGGSL